MAIGASIGAKSYPAPVLAASHTPVWMRTSPENANVPSRSGGAVVVVDDDVVGAVVVVVVGPDASTAGSLSSRVSAKATPPASTRTTTPTGARRHGGVRARTRP